jgi:hypothetical protein
MELEADDFTGDSLCLTGGVQPTLLTLCMGSPAITFGGAFQCGPSGCVSACRTSNPRTGACSCPAGADDTPFLVTDNGGSPVTIHVCTMLP